MGTTKELQKRNSTELEQFQTLIVEKDKIIELQSKMIEDILTFNRNLVREINNFTVTTGRNYGINAGNIPEATVNNNNENIGGIRTSNVLNGSRNNESIIASTIKNATINVCSPECAKRMKFIEDLLSEQLKKPKNIYNYMYGENQGFQSFGGDTQKVEMENNY